MLVEALVYAASFPGTPRDARPHLTEAVGLWARGRRRRTAWADHTKNTRDAIIDTIAGIKSRRTAVVLGSGSLFDVPLEELAQAFSRVVLVDRIHLLPARLRARGLRDVGLLHRDLSQPSHDPLGFLAEIGDLDWVISVNLVSQLGVGAPDGTERVVIDAHLDALRRLPCAVTLVTDLDYRVIDRNGSVTEKVDLLYGRPMPPPARRWTWVVAPFGEEGAATRRVHAVTFYPDWKAAGGG